MPSQLFLRVPHGSLELNSQMKRDNPIKETKSTFEQLSQGKAGMPQVPGHRAGFPCSKFQIQVAQTQLGHTGNFVGSTSSPARLISTKTSCRDGHGGIISLTTPKKEIVHKSRLSSASTGWEPTGNTTPSAVLNWNSCQEFLLTSTELSNRGTARKATAAFLQPDFLEIYPKKKGKKRSVEEPGAAERLLTQVFCLVTAAPRWIWGWERQDLPPAPCKKALSARGYGCSAIQTGSASAAGGRPE